MQNFSNLAVENVATPNCQVMNCEATAIHFSLPGCPQGRNRDYMAVIIPQQNHKPPLYSISPAYDNLAETTGCHNRKNKVCQDASCQYEKKICGYDQWSTEYRSTIDDCGRRVMTHEVECRKRSPIYPRCYFTKAAEECTHDTYYYPSLPKPNCREETGIRPIECHSKMIQPNEFLHRPQYVERKSELRMAEITKANKQRQGFSKHPVKPIKSALPLEPEDDANVNNTCGEMTGHRPMHRCFPLKRDVPDSSNTGMLHQSRAVASRPMRRINGVSYLMGNAVSNLQKTPR